MATTDGKVLELVVFNLRAGASREELLGTQAAAERAMGSESCAPMFGLIDMESTLMVHGERVHAA